MNSVEGWRASAVNIVPLSTEFHEKDPWCLVILINSQNIGRRALFSYRAWYNVIEFSNFRTEERNEAEFFCTF